MSDLNIETVITELLEAYPDPVMVDDSKGGIHFVNSAFEDTFRVSRKQIQYYDFEDFTAPEHRSKLLKLHISRLAGKAVPASVEFTGLRTDGKRIFLRSTVSRIISGDSSFFLTILRRVSGSGEPSDTERENIAFKSSLLACRNIYERIQNDPQPDILETLRNTLSPCNDLMERVDAGMLVLELAGNLKKLLDGTVRVSFSVDPGIPEVFLPVKGLREVLRAVIDNSLDALEHGGHIHLRTMVEDGTGTRGEDQVSPASPRRIRIEIADDGTGMDNDVLSRAFEPFFTTKDTQRHSGMGLFNARLRLREIAGEIRMVSSVGSGTVVSIFLPCT